MKTKKSSKVDLKNKRGLFLEIGLIISLTICLYAFEWTTEKLPENKGFTFSTEAEFEPIIPVIEDKIPEPEPEPELEKIHIEEFEIVTDDEKADKIDFVGGEDDNKPSPFTIKIPVDNLPEPEPTEVIDWVNVQDKPEFPGGEPSLLKFIKQNTVYPKKALEADMYGRVYVQFVIDKNGKVTDVTIAQGVDPYLDAEALRVVRLLPDWKPGKQRGKEVAVSYIIPITFKLSR